MRRAASSGDSWKMRWEEGSIQPRECTSTREGSRAPIWSHGARGFMRPMRTFLGSPISVMTRKADRQEAPANFRDAECRGVGRLAEARESPIRRHRASDGTMVPMQFQDLPIPGRGTRGTAYAA